MSSAGDGGGGGGPTEEDEDGLEEPCDGGFDGADERGELEEEGYQEGTHGTAPEGEVPELPERVGEERRRRHGQGGVVHGREIISGWGRQAGSFVQS
jgi:hypothetical protein